LFSAPDAPVLQEVIGVLFPLLVVCAAVQVRRLYVGQASAGLARTA